MLGVEINLIDSQDEGIVAGDGVTDVAVLGVDDAGIDFDIDGPLGGRGERPADFVVELEGVLLPTPVRFCPVRLIIPLPRVVSLAAFLIAKRPEYRSLRTSRKGRFRVKYGVPGILMTILATLGMAWKRS